MAKRRRPRKSRATKEDPGAKEIGDSIPRSPSLGKLRRGMPTRLHVLGDIHGWAPGLINYLISNKLADISIDGKSLGSKGNIDEEAMQNAFAGAAKTIPPGGLRGMPGSEGALNGEGVGPIKARWIASGNVSLVQIGDVIDRADHSEVASEILRQLILDAPNRVFVLVGNHEQFMLENSSENWLMNEERNAIKSNAEVFAGKTDGKHHRFLPSQSFDDPIERGVSAVFPCYRNSVFTLFLTQASAQQRSGFVDRKLDDSVVGGMLSSGWAPYVTAAEFSESKFEPGGKMPGAIAALVMGENLLHHAEPGEHLAELVDEFEWEGDFGWFDYSFGGGSIQGSAHSPLLWTRESSRGALSGSPKSEGLISDLQSKWPGLYRIIHGHSPTGSVEEFVRAMGPDVSSTSCSYLGESQSTTPIRGKASGIRIYNVDEGVSPVYYRGSGPKNDLTRVPVGLRVAGDELARKEVIVHTAEHRILEIERGKDVRKDTRELWAWSPGQARLTGDNWWEKPPAASSGTLEFDNSFWMVVAKGPDVEILGRRLSGYEILPNILRTLVADSGILSGVTLEKPPEPSSALKYIKGGDGSDPLSWLSNPKKGKRESWKSAEHFGIIAFGFSENGNWTLVNATDEIADFDAFDGSEPKRIAVEPRTIHYGKMKISGGFCISTDEKAARESRDYWLAKTDERPTNMSISFMPRKKSKTTEVTMVKAWEFPSEIAKPESVTQSKEGPEIPKTEDSVSLFKKAKDGISAAIDSVIPSSYPTGSEEYLREQKENGNGLELRNDKAWEEKRSSAGKPSQQGRYIEQERARLGGDTVGTPRKLREDPSEKPLTQKKTLRGTKTEDAVSEIHSIGQKNGKWKITVTREEFASLLTKLGFSHKKALGPSTSFIFYLEHEGNFQMSVLNPHPKGKNTERWNIAETGIREKKKATHGFHGREFEDLFKNTEFKEWLYEWHIKLKGAQPE